MHRKLWIVLLLQGLALSFFGGVASAQSQEKAWTIMVFINADNNLDSAGVADVNEMERVGSNERVNVLVQLDRSEVEGTTRLYVERDDSPEVTSPVVLDLGEVDMGDWKQAFDFFSWGVQNYPAERYAFVIWNHGRGWRRQTDGGTVITTGTSGGDDKGVSYDDGSGNHIKTTELRPMMAAMAERLGRRVDLLGFDACLMQMGEVAGEVKDHVAVQVGAEHVEASDGWPYDEIIAALQARPDMDEKALGKEIVDLYVNSYRDGSQGSENANQSALDLRAFDGFRNRLDAFADALLALPHRAGDLGRIMDETQAFDVYQYKDLGDFVVRVLAEISNDAVQKAGKELLRFYRSELVVGNGATGRRLEGSTGLSLWFPEVFFHEKLVEAYGQLAFAKESRWDEFLEGCYHAQAPALAVIGVDCDGPGREILPGDVVEISAGLRNAGEVDSGALELRLEVKNHWVEPMVVQGTMEGVSAHRNRRTRVLRLRVSEHAPDGAEIPVTLVVTDEEGHEYRGEGRIRVVNPQPGTTTFAAHGVGDFSPPAEERRMMNRREAFGHLFD